MENTTLVKIAANGIEKLNNDEVVAIYHALKQKDHYKLLDKFKSQMELKNSPQDIRFFLENMIDVLNYGADTGIKGFIYNNDIKKFFDKNDKDIIPLLEDNENFLVDRKSDSTPLDLMVNSEQKLSNFALEIYARYICNLEHGINLNQDLSLKNARNPQNKNSQYEEEPTLTKSKSRGR